MCAPACSSQRDNIRPLTGGTLQVMRKNREIVTKRAMIIHPQSETPITSFRRFTEDAEFLERTIAEQQIVVPSAGPLSEALAAARVIGSGSTLPNAPAELGKVAGLSYLVRLLAGTTRRGLFDRVKRHLRYLADTSSNPLPTVLAPASQSRNMVLELEVACLGACCGFDIVLADEPDVQFVDLCSWDIACKDVTSENPVSVADRIEKGIRQVLSFDGAYGLVVLGLANRIDHRAMLPLLSPEEDIWGAFRSFESAQQAVRATLKTVIGEIQEQAQTRFLSGKEDHKFRGILLVGHAACGVTGVVAFLSMMALVTRADLYGTPLLEGPEQRLCERLNTAAHHAFVGP